MSGYATVSRSIAASTVLSSPASPRGTPRIDSSGIMLGQSFDSVVQR